jgi:TetR/AcrR family transcriptional regulator, regulator of cefoperazone and chloramphenicol sensitivity
MSPQSPAPRRRLRSRPEDEGGTRTLLLEAAGEIFALKGFDRATGREICERAAVNPAAINYHYGGMEELYLSVLVEAHRRLMTVDSLSALASSSIPAPEKLRAVIDHFVQAAMGTTASSWAFRVLGREIAMPTPMFETLRIREILPKIGHLRQIVAELTHLPDDHPAITRGVVSTIAPCMLMLIADRGSFAQLFPNLGQGPGVAAPLVDHLVRFALAGLAKTAEMAGIALAPEQDGTAAAPL